MNIDEILSHVGSKNGKHGNSNAKHSIELLIEKNIIYLIIDEAFKIPIKFINNNFLDSIFNNSKNVFEYFDKVTRYNILNMFKYVVTSVSLLNKTKINWCDDINRMKIMSWVNDMTYVLYGYNLKKEVDKILMDNFTFML